MSLVWGTSRLYGPARKLFMEATSAKVVPHVDHASSVCSLLCSHLCKNSCLSQIPTLVSPPLADHKAKLVMRVQATVKR
jgi:hypothetical protein